jgi:hypothetical protein
MKIPTALALLMIGALPALAIGPILVDFGVSAKPTEVTDGITWNNVDEKNQRNLANMLLVDATGVPSDIRLEIVSPFGGANQYGAKGETVSYPLNAVVDSLFGNVEMFGKLENVTPVIRLSGLKPDAKYKLSFFASRMGADDDRSTRYTVTGASSAFVDLNAANNREKIVMVEQSVPSADGTLTISLTPAPTNNNKHHFTYLSVLEIELLR